MAMPPPVCALLYCTVPSVLLLARRIANQEIKKSDQNEIFTFKLRSRGGEEYSSAGCGGGVVCDHGSRIFDRAARVIYTSSRVRTAGDEPRIEAAIAPHKDM
jgi:hypothetical protein